MNASVTSPVIEMRGVSFGWPGAAEMVLNGVDFTLKAGEAVCLKAPSGRGKTTFLRLAAGLLQPLKGICRRNFRRPAFAFQEQRLLPWLDAAGNIAFAAGCSRDDACGWLERCGLENCASRMPDEMSGGQCQRVNLMRALAAKPDVIFLDEPFSGLDDAGAVKFADLLSDWRGEHPLSALLMVSHLPEGARMCGADVMDFGID